MEVAKSFGLTLSFEKTKVMVVGYGVDEGDMLYHLTSLVAVLTGLVSSPDLSITTKRYIYRACVFSVLLYGSECCVPLK